MSTDRDRADEPVGGGLSIGELARRTAVATATLRAWETRHGFPPSTRTPSGHRRYAPDTVAAVEEVVRRQQAGARLDRAISETRSSHGTPRDSVYATLRVRHPHLPVLELRKGTMVRLSRAIEDECLASARRATMFGGFQTTLNYERARDRWDALAEMSSTTWVFADFTHDAPVGVPEAVHVPLDSSAPLRREWVVVCDAPDLPVAMSAWEPPGQEDTPDRQRVFECLWTLEPAAVRDASRVCAAVAESVQAPGAAQLSRQLLTAPVGTVDAGAATRLFSRLLRYIDAD